jgi:hypothetical protein
VDDDGVGVGWAGGHVHGHDREHAVSAGGGDGGGGRVSSQRRCSAPSERTHGANKNSSSPSTLLLRTKLTCLHLFIMLCWPLGSK